MKICAWVGEDERGSGIVGIKQAITPVGLIPLVSSIEGRMSQRYLIEAMHSQSVVSGKRIYLARFVFEEIEMEAT